MNAEQKSKTSRIQDHKGKIESDKSQLNQHILNFQEEGTKASEAFSRTLDRSKTKVLLEIRSLKKVIDQLTTNLEDYKERSLESDKNALNERLANLIGEIASGVEELKNVLVQLSTKQEEDISTIYGGLGNQVSTGLTDIYASQRDQLGQFEKEISSRLDEIKKNIMSIVERENTNQQEFAKNVSSSINESLIDFHKNIRDLSNVKENEINTIFSGTMTKSISRLEIAKEGLNAGLDGATQKLDKTLTHQKSINEELQNDVNKNIDESRSEVKKQVERLRFDTVEEWKSRQNEQLEALKAIQDSSLHQYEEALSVNETFQKKLLSDLEHHLRSSVYTEIDNISLSFNQFQDSFIDKVDSLISRLTNFRDEIKENLNTLLISNVEKIGDISKQTEEHLSEVFSEVSKEYENSRKNTLSSLSKAVKERFGSIIDYVDQFESTLDTKMEKTATNLDDALMDFHDTTGRNTGESINRNSATLAAFRTNIVESFNNLQSSQDENIEKTLIDLQNILRSKQTDLITAMSTLETMAEGHIEKHRLSINENSTETFNISAAAFDGLKKEIMTLRQDSTSTIQNIIETTHHELDENVNSSEEKARGLVEGLEDEHKNEIAEFRSKASQEINQKQQLLDDYISSLKVKFTKFFDDQHQTLDHFISESRSKRETVTNIRKNLDTKIEEVSSHIDSATENFQNNLNINTQTIITSANQVIGSIDDLLESLK
ncbi:MAG: hypothetical protein ACXADY_07260 [Candidatus Hodarchaeales archaeon]|jgi:hypothetical protein